MNSTSLQTSECSTSEIPLHYGLIEQYFFFSVFERIPSTDIIKIEKK